MSYHRKSDFGVVDFEDEQNFGLLATIDLDKDYTDETVHRSPSGVSDMSRLSTDSGPSRQIRSASISVATGPTPTGLSFILDMEKEDAIDHVDSLHDDIEKMFDKQPEMTITDLISSGAECVPSERRHESTEVPVPISERSLEEYDITSHRRSSFPHIHVPLKSLHSHSVKNFASYLDESELQREEQRKEKKKKKKKHKNKPKLPKKSKSNVFPSKSAMVSASIPEVEKEEYSESDDSKSSYDDDADDTDDAYKLLDDADETTRLLNDIDDENEKFNLLGDSERTHKLFIDSEEDIDHVDTGTDFKLYISETDLSAGAKDTTEATEEKKNERREEEEQAKKKDENAHLCVPWIIGDEESNKSDSSIHPGLFYIGSAAHVHEDSPPVDIVPTSSVVSTASSTDTFPGFIDSTPIVVVLNNDDRPLVSTSVREASNGAAVQYLENEKSKVMFLLGEETEDSEPQFDKPESSDDKLDSDDSSTSSADESSDQDQGNQEREPFIPHGEHHEEHGHHRHEKKHADEPVWEKKEEARRYKRSSSTESPRPRHKHHRHHHHENYGTEDLKRRRQRGSEVQMSDALKRVPTVTENEEAITLQKVDLDEMASHRMADLQGIRKHKIGRKKHKTVSSVVYVGKSDKPRRKYFQPKKQTYDHSPHEVFVELDELYMHENYEVEWREKARWIKFEEDVEEGAERWGKPHVASLSFHSLLELRKGLESGSLILDLEATDLIGIAHRVVEDMVIRDQIHSDVKGQVMRTILTKHKFVSMDTVKSLLRRNKSSMDLLAMEERHQRDQMSIMKTLSQASFSQIPSTANLQALAQQSYNSNSNSAHNDTSHTNNNSGHHPQRSQSLPNDTNHVTNNSKPLAVPSKKEKKAKKDKDKKKTVGDPGRLEFVKVDVDNNMTDSEGVHIGIVPKDADLKDARSDHKMSLMRRIPRDAEACTVLVGCVDYLDKPAMAFVRLAEKQVLDNLTEVPLPVRFVFILLGPERTTTMDYHEVGRSISTLMSNQHFHDIAYKAETRSEILHAINEFLNESIVLPPGDWDQKTLLPVMDMARKRAKVRRKKQKKKEELEALIRKETEKQIPMDPLKRTGRPFGGLINDIRRRFPHYISDFKDGLNLQCVMALIFIFFACLCPCIAFGGLYAEKTYGKIGVMETIISTALSNLVFGLFSGQPLILYGATGPVLVFEKHLFSFCKESGIDFLTWRVWIGLWVFIITCIVIALEGSFIVKHITRFTEEVFAILISLIFINEVIQKLIHIYHDHPLRGKEFYCNRTNNSFLEDNNNITNDYNITNIVMNISTARTVRSLSSLGNYSTTMYSTKREQGDHGEAENGHDYGHEKNKYSDEPNTALLSTILILGTFLIAYFLRIFRNSRFLGRSARRALGDFGIFTAIVCMVLFDYLCRDTFTQKLEIPTTFAHSDASMSKWFVNPMGEKKPMEVWLMFVAVIPAFLIFLLLFLESQLTQMLLHKNEFKLKKGTGFHLDQFILGVITFLCALFGLPWMCPATVRSVAHVSALAVMSRTHAPGEKPKLLGVKDQRVTNLVMNILIGSTLAWGDVLRAVPMAVLFGVFLYLGVSAISGVQFFKRIKLLFMPVKHHPGKSYVRQVRTVKMHIFTIIQLVLVALLWIVKTTVVAIAFPLFVFLMVPLRLKIMPKFFTHNELAVLDKEEEDSDDEDDDDPDFYQLAHMPI